MFILKRGIHTGLVGDLEDEGVVQKGQADRLEGDEEGLERLFHSMVVSGYLYHDLLRFMERGCWGGGGSAPGGLLHQYWTTGIGRPPGNSPQHEGTPHGGSHVRDL